MVTLANTKWRKKNLKNNWNPGTLVLIWVYAASPSNKYQHDWVKMIFKNLCVLVLWIKVALVLKGLTLVSQLGRYKMMQKTWKRLKLWQLGTHLRVLNKSYLMNTNMTGLRVCALDEGRLSIGRVKRYTGTGILVSNSLWEILVSCFTKKWTLLTEPLILNWIR